MTLGELYEAVSYLGFETALDDEVLRRGFYAVLGRALQSVNALRPRSRRVRISHIAPRRLLSLSTPRPLSAGESLGVRLDSTVRQLSLSLFGVGRLSVADAEGERVIPFSSLGESRISLDCQDPSSLSVTAEGEVTLASVEGYGERLSFGERLSSGATQYDVARLASDFAAFASPALYLDGKPYLGEYETEETTLRLPSEAPSGLYEVAIALAMPRYGVGDSPDLELPLAPELAAILPELVASMIWLDDAPDKASYYASLYQKNYARLYAEARGAHPLGVYRTNGW